MKKCKTCKEPFEPIKKIQGKCIQCTLNRARELSIISAKKSQQRAEKQRKQANKQTRENLKSLGDYKEELQTQINKIVRLIDFGCGCISCGTKSGQFQAGHFRAVGGWDNLRYNLNNIFLQCSTCNDPKRKGGNVIKFRENLLSKFGAEYMNYLDDLNVIYPFFKWNKIELQEKTAICKEIVKELINLNEVGITPRSIYYRLELRVLYNKKVGLYI
jgi:hypothetical protein